MQSPIQSVGERIARYRKLSGLSMQALAERAGLTKSSVANIEYSRRDDLTVRELVALAYALEVSPLALLFDMNHLRDPADIADWLPADLKRTTVLELIEWFSLRDEAPAEPGTARYMLERARQLEEVLSEHETLLMMRNTTETALGDVTDRMQEAGDDVPQDLAELEKVTRKMLEWQDADLQRLRRQADSIQREMTANGPA